MPGISSYDQANTSINSLSRLIKSVLSSLLSVSPILTSLLMVGSFEISTVSVSSIIGVLFSSVSIALIISLSFSSLVKQCSSSLDKEKQEEYGEEDILLNSEIITSDKEMSVGT